MISLEEAQEIAGEYLLDHVGNLLMEGEPTVVGGNACFPVSLTCAAHGDMGVIGSIGVDLASGKVLFSDEQRREIKTRARQLWAEKGVLL